jgi:hypothetical protein
MLPRQSPRVGLVTAALALLPVLIVALAPQLALRAQANDALLGTWILERGKSTFSGAVPERRTMTFEKVDKGIRHTTETLQGEVTYRLQYVFEMDGKDYPADVQMPVASVSFKRIDANKIERSGKYQGAVVETVTYQLSAGGKVLTATQKGNINGAEVSSTQVFNRK